MKNVVKTIIFVIAWMLSFTCGIYLFGAIFIGTPLSVIDAIMNGCGFTLGMLWLWFNVVRL